MHIQLIDSAKLLEVTNVPVKDTKFDLLLDQKHLKLLLILENQ